MDILREAAARKARTAENEREKAEQQWRTPGAHGGWGKGPGRREKAFVLGCAAREVTPEERRTHFWRSKSRGETPAGKAAQVPFEALMWQAERAADRVTTQYLNVSPEDLRSPVQRRLFDALDELLANEVAQEAAEILLGSGIAPAPWYAWHALEEFRTAQLEPTAERDELARDEARNLLELFCDSTSALYVPVGDVIRGTIERVLHSTPEHIDIGRKLFLGMQSKIMVEMERFVLPHLLRDEDFRALVREEGIIVVAHLSMAELLFYPELCRIFGGYLAKCDPEANRVLEWLKLETVSARCAVLERDNDLVATLRRAANDQSVQHALERRRDEDVQTLEAHAFFFLRDTCLTDFMWTEGYLRCLSILAGVDLAALGDAYATREVMNVNNEKAGAGLASKKGRRARRPHAENKWGDNQAPDVQAGSALGEETEAPQSARGLERDRPHLLMQRLVHPFRRGDQLGRTVKRSATPRDWKYAHRCCCERVARKQGDLRIGASSANGSQRRVLVGLEGVMTHPRLRQGAKAFVSASYRPVDQHAIQVLHALKALRRDDSPLPFLEAATPLLTQYVDSDFASSASDEELDRVCTNIFARRYMPLLTALSTLSQKFRG
ncbi:Hypothetical Protein FCC1311_064982 [Hondaea fermentalgiana]|uniref:Uncharacterized protein n=1 Tax=Hondaea fermentalgiana TaxID=2315210 RepID=A0A2R5GIY8_9STRA|nr:Hypothetical Protein FCC1311_064982 [Hondaea fermentalgiana]|eukprot:GBG30279.1 Hypothetical Protein FCC1311_064982 [Hondaea fermentalgiana]